MELHIEGMIEEGLEIPKPTSRGAGFVKLSYMKNKPKVLAVV